MKLIKRDTYLNKLVAFKDKQVIKVITGIRRCGKSTLMGIYRKWLLANGVEERHIISINFEDFDYYGLRNPHTLYSYIKERMSENETTYIFLDEIQHVDNFPAVVDSLYIKKGVSHELCK